MIKISKKSLDLLNKENENGVTIVVSKYNIVVTPGFDFKANEEAKGNMVVHLNRRPNFEWDEKQIKLYLLGQAMCNDYNDLADRLAGGC